MAEQPTIDGVTRSAQVTGVKGAGDPVMQWKKRFVIIGGVAYLLYVAWAVFLVAVLPSAALHALVSIGVLSLIVGGLLLLAVGAVGLMRISQPTFPAAMRARGLILLLAIVVPGVLVSAVVPFLILRTPALAIAIVSPEHPEDFIAPVQMKFSVADAVREVSASGFQPIQYVWDVNGDGKTDQTTLVPELTVRFDREGVYHVSVAMVDGNGSRQQAVRSFVIQQSVFTILVSPVIVNKPTVLSVAHIVKDPSTLSEVQWDYDNDGKTDETTKQPQVSHTFHVVGRATVAVTVVLQSQTQQRYQRSFDVIEPPALPFPVSIVSEPGFLVSPPPFPTLWHIETKEPVSQVTWDFGDGTKAEGQQAAHTFTGNGSFVVQATVYSKTGSAASLTEVVQLVEPLMLQDLSFEGTPAVQGSTIEGEVPLVLNLRPRTTVPFVQFFWEAPDATEVGSTDTNLQAIYRRPGTYNLTLVAHDAENHVLRRPMTVTVKPPSSSLSIHMNPETGVAPLTVQFDASETFIPNETITGFEWRFGDNAPVIVGGAHVEHIFEKEGTYTIGLTVHTTSGKQFQDTRTIAVRAPVLSACVLPSRTTGTAPLGVEFTSACSTGVGTLQYLWDFGDASQSDEKNPIHVFVTPGTYTVTLTLTDATKRTSQQSVSITVTP